METNANAPGTLSGTLTCVDNAAGYIVGAGRVEKAAPDGYRLAKKPNGEIVLQGAYLWQQGRDYGHNWRDIPTVELS